MVSFHYFEKGQGASQHWLLQECLRFPVLLLLPCVVKQGSNSKMGVWPACCFLEPQRQNQHLGLSLVSQVRVSVHWKSPKKRMFALMAPLFLGMRIYPQSCWVSSASGASWMYRFPGTGTRSEKI